MSRQFKRPTVMVLALCPVLLAGCATQQGNDQLLGAGAGALGGAALGCLIGYAAGGSSGCVTGAIAGGVAGAAVGWGTVKYNQYQATQLRTQQQEQRLYGLARSVDSPQVKFRKGTSNPKQIKPGGVVNVSTEYSLQLPKNMSSAQVTESLVLKKDGKQLAELPQQQVREAGGWGATGSIPLPSNTPPGTYVVEHQVKVGSSYDTGESTFVVAK